MIDPLFCLVSAVAVVSIGLNIVMCRAYDALAVAVARHGHEIADVAASQVATDHQARRFAGQAMGAIVAHEDRLRRLEVKRADVFSLN